MGFLDKAKKAAQDAKEKTTEIIEISKVNRQIGQQEDKIKETYVSIGKQVFSEFENGGEVNADIKNLCDEIIAAQEAIKELKAQILVIKNIKLCPNCNTEIQIDIAFCPNCGTKQAEQTK